MYSLVCDIPLAIKKIKSGKIDQQANILNCLNSFYDILDVMKMALPLTYKKNLFQFAQHLTFDRDILKFLNESKIKNGIFKNRT